MKEYITDQLRELSNQFLKSTDQADQIAMDHFVRDLIEGTFYG